MSEPRPMQAVEAYLLILGKNYQINFRDPHYDPKDCIAGWVDAVQDNWKEIAQAINNLGVHISYHSRPNAPTDTVYFSENEDWDTHKHLVKHPPYTFKA